MISRPGRTTGIYGMGIMDIERFEHLSLILKQVVSHIGVVETRSMHVN